MLIRKFETEQEWLDARRGKVTGTRLKDLTVKNGKGAGFYDLLAERLAVPSDDENAMARGKRLEEDAVTEFKVKNGKDMITDLVIWERDDNSSIAISPDAYSEDLTEAVEVKCLGSGRHIEAVLNNEIPKDYKFQVLQYFIVNDKLETLYFVMYDPRLIVKQYVQFMATREALAPEIEAYLDLEKERLAEIDDIVAELTGF